MSVAGARVSQQRTFAEADFHRFAAVSGDANPIHVDPEFAARTRFGRVVAHGLLLLTIVRGLIERLLPGGRQQDQQVVFPAPTYADQPMRFEARVLDSHGGRATVEFKVSREGDGEITCQGRSRVRLAQ